MPKVKGVCSPMKSSESTFFFNISEEEPHRLVVTGPPMAKVDVDSLIVRLLSVGSPGGSIMNTVKEAELLALCTSVKQVFLSQSALVEVEPPMNICGDTHGHYADVLRLFDRGGFPPLVNYLFLGDYVDRGHHNIEVVTLFFCYKTKYPLNFFLLRGNHECAAINRVYGFYEECIRKYQSVRLWQAYQDVFCSMPYCGLVGGRILCMHGGLSPKMKSIEQLRNMTRPAEIANPSIHLDLLWSDPDYSTKGWAANTRGVGFAFGEDVLKKTIQLLDIDLVVRAHQVVQDGYEFFGKKRLVTVFSAPHYCGQFDNAAAIMNVDDSLLCSFHIIRPTTKLTKVTAQGNG